MARPHPISAPIAVATLKRYIADPHSRIRLEDLVRDETERAYAKLCSKEFLGQECGRNQAGVKAKFDFYNASLTIPLSLLIHGCYWGDSQHLHLWARMLERFAGALGIPGTVIMLPDLRLYPPALFLYGGGLAALMANRYDTLAALLERPQVRKLNYVTKSMTVAILDGDVPEALRDLLGIARRFAPLGEYFHEQLRPLFRDIEPDDRAYDCLFDRFDCLLSLTYGHLVGKNERKYMPVVRFGWRRCEGHDALEYFKAEQAKEGGNWLPLKAGMFGGDPQRFSELVLTLEEG
jgi:hypothetical protein